MSTAKLSSVGQAKQREGKRPTRFEEVRRGTVRLWLLYPRPLRGYIKVIAQISAAFILVIAGVLAVEGIVSWVARH